MQHNTQLPWPSQETHAWLKHSHPLPCSVFYSFGISVDYTFDRFLSQNYSCRGVAFDPSIAHNSTLVPGGEAAPCMHHNSKRLEGAGRKVLLTSQHLGPQGQLAKSREEGGLAGLSTRFLQLQQQSLPSTPLPMAALVMQASSCMQPCTVLPPRSRALKPLARLPSLSSPSTL